MDDRERRARSIRSGGPAPDGKALAKLETKLAEAKRELEAADLALEQEANALVELVKVRREQWIAEIESRSEERREEERKALEAYQFARHLRMADESVIAFLRQWPSGKLVPPAKRPRARPPRPKR